AIGGSERASEELRDGPALMGRERRLRHVLLVGAFATAQAVRICEGPFETREMAPESLEIEVHRNGGPIGTDGHRGRGRREPARGDPVDEATGLHWGSVEQDGQ